MAMTSNQLRPTFAAYWKSVHDRIDWARNERFLGQILSMQRNYSKNANGPTSGLWNSYLNCRVWAHGQTSDLALRYLEAAYAAAQSAWQVNGFESEEVGGVGFPRNRLNFLTDKVFIDGFVKHQPLNRDDVIQISKDVIQLATSYGPRDYDSVPQSRYVHTLELLLLVDARDEAQDMVNKARSMQGLHIKELFRNVKLILKSKTPVKDNLEAKTEYRRMFDMLRDPKYPDSNRGHPGMPYSTLIMACMWQKFYEPGDGSYDYDRAVDLMWE